MRQAVGRFGPVDVAVVFAGGARAAVRDRAPLTLDSARPPEAARVLGATHCLPLHRDRRAHFTEDRDDLRTGFGEAGLADRLTPPAPGRPASL